MNTSKKLKPICATMLLAVASSWFPSSAAAQEAPLTLLEFLRQPTDRTCIFSGTDLNDTLAGGFIAVHLPAVRGDIADADGVLINPEAGTPESFRMFWLHGDQVATSACTPGAPDKAELVPLLLLPDGELVTNVTSRSWSGAACELGQGAQSGLAIPCRAEVPEPPFLPSTSQGSLPSPPIIEGPTP